MRIVFAHEFDPAGVHVGYRRAMGAVPGGVEAFVLAKRAYLHRADFDAAEVALAVPPDAIVVCPGVGSGDGDWAAGSATRGVDNLPAWVEDILRRFPAAKRVALFHGSPHTEAFLAPYMEHWRTRGFALAATTLNYATEMRAAWLPPYVDVWNLRAKPHDPQDPLVIVQTPSVPELCHTTAFVKEARAAGAIPIIANHLPHHQCLWLKAQFSVGFDHLRGSFSVNTLENAALGLVPIFALKRPYLARLHVEGVEAPPVMLSHSLVEEIAYLVKHPDLVAGFQREAREWWEKHFSREKIAARLVKFFRSL